MKKVILGIFIGLMTVAVLVNGAFALPMTPSAEKARKNSPAIDDVTGEVKAPPEFVADLPESELSTVMFIRYAPEKAPACDSNGVCEPRENWKNCPEDCSKGGEEEPEETVCYDFLTGSKPRWNWVENYYYSTSELGTTSARATQTWDDATSATIFGSGVSEANPWGIYDYKNSVSFDDYKDPDVIAVAKIWFRGKNIYEYDIMFDVNYFPGNGSIDLDTVALHEFGHGAGLGDLYDTDCISEVMYGIYDGVDLDLGKGDTIGIQKLYGI